MKKILFIFVLFPSTLYFTQVGINTTNPLGTLHIDGAKDNPASDVPSVVQQSNDISVTPAGDLGIGTVTPNAKLEVKGKVSVSPNGTGNASSIDYYENTANGSNKVSLQAPTNLPADRNITLPANTPQNGYVLITNGSGVTSWGAVNPSQSTLASISLNNASFGQVNVLPYNGTTVGSETNLRFFQKFDNVVTDPNGVFTSGNSTYTYTAPQAGNYLISAYIVPNASPYVNKAGFYYPVNLEIRKNCTPGDPDSGINIMDTSVIRYATPNTFRRSLRFSVLVNGMVKLDANDRLNVVVLLKGENHSSTNNNQSFNANGDVVPTTDGLGGSSFPTSFTYATGADFKAYFSVTAL